MLNFRGRWCVAVWVCLFALRATADVYNDLILVDQDNYVDDDYIDTGPLSVKSEDQANEALLHKLIQSIVAGDGNHISQVMYRPQWDFTDDKSNQTLNSDLPNTSINKRVAGVRGVTKEQPKVFRSIIKARRKLQNKKVKLVGSQMVCYFKLCAFRRPVY